MFKRLVIYGTGELAELACLTFCETDLVFVGFVARPPSPPFLSHPRLPLESMVEWDFDAGLIAELKNTNKVRARLIQVAALTQKVCVLYPVSESEPRMPPSVEVHSPYTANPSRIGGALYVTEQSCIHEQ